MLVGDGVSSTVPFSTDSLLLNKSRFLHQPASRGSSRTFRLLHPNTEPQRQIKHQSHPQLTSQVTRSFWFHPLRTSRNHVPPSPRMGRQYLSLGQCDGHRTLLRGSWYNRAIFHLGIARRWSSHDPVVHDHEANHCLELLGHVILCRLHDYH